MAYKLPRIACPKCNLTQNYRGQEKCLHCQHVLEMENLIEQIQFYRWEMQMKFSDKDEKPGWEKK